MADENYEGLNLSQLLDLMHGIAVPEPVSWMPVTEGWWVLGIWLFAAFGLSLARYLYRRRRNAYRREALGLLDEIDVTAAGAAADVALIVKRTALAAYARNEVASLHGAAWARFLIESARHDRHVEQSAELIAAAAYREAVDATEIVEPAKRWVKVHRA